MNHSTIYHNNNYASLHYENVSKYTPMSYKRICARRYCSVAIKILLEMNSHRLFDSRAHFNNVVHLCRWLINHYSAIFRFRYFYENPFDFYFVRVPSHSLARYSFIIYLSVIVTMTRQKYRILSRYSLTNR